MKTPARTIIILLATVMITASCARKISHTGTDDPAGSQVAGPQLIIYKTVAIYDDKVPVILSNDKGEIVSYPGVRDVYYKGSLAYPTPLESGFLLDNRGINKNVAFLSLTYKEYSELDKTPPPGELFKLIIDNDPLTEMYECGLRSQYDDPVQELNKKILAGEFSDFKRLK